MSHHPNASNNAWGTAPLPSSHSGPGQQAAASSAASAAGPRQSRRGVTILIAVVVLVLLLLAAAEFGFRAYLKNQVADGMTTSAEEQGIELSGDPEVGFSASPVLLGVIRGKIPALTVDLPSSMNITYQDSDRSRPVIEGQPASTIKLRDMELSGDNPLAGELILSTTLPREYLLAVINQSMTSTPTEDQGSAGGLLSGLIQVTGVNPNPDTGTLDIELSGGLATLSMSPHAVDGSLSFDVADLKILGMSLPDELVNEVSQSLTQSVGKTKNLDITTAEVTSDGLKVQLRGTDVRIDDIAAEANSTTNVTVTGGATGAVA